MTVCRYRHVLFDLDGTLFDTYEANMLSLKEVLTRMQPGVPHSDEELDALFGVPGLTCLKALGFNDAKAEEGVALWTELILPYAYTVKLFPHVESVLKALISAGCTLGIVTSRRRYAELEGTLGDCLPPVIAPYFKYVISADDVKAPKPAPDSLLKYMEITGAKREEILFVGDALTDLQCADSAGVDFALALWGAKLQHHVRCAYYFKSPYDVLLTVLRERTGLEEKWFRWAGEMQAIGQIGLAYCRNIFDEERYTRLRELASEILMTYTGKSEKEVNQSFLFDKGYITPKVDTRAAIFNEQGEILMVREKLSGLWNIPGGWCDEHESLVSNTVKEVREEAGLEVHVERLIAVVDRNAHNTPPLPYGALKAFLLCKKAEVDSPFIETDETMERAYFAEDALPLQELRLDTNTPLQLRMCFAAFRDPHFVPVIE